LVILSFLDTSTSTAVPDHPIASLMYYLSCINSITTVNLPSHVTFCESCDNASSDDVAEVIAACIFVDPRILAHQGLVIWDSDCEICQPGENRFFSASDSEMSEFGDRDGGQGTTLTQVMAFGFTTFWQSAMSWTSHTKDWNK
jgi:hypothetical protein